MSKVVIACVLVVSAVAAQKVRAQTTEMIVMGDTVELATHLFLPEGAGPFPTILMRTPYGREQLVELAVMGAAIGFAVVIQDVRGSGDSQGEVDFFQHDAADGLVTLDWIEAQAWSNGDVATFGPSALGIVQYILAPEHPSQLRCQVIQTATPDVYAHAAYHGGVFRHALVTGWLNWVGGQANLPDIRANPIRNEYWAVGSIGERYGDITVPAFHIGGWYDIFSQGTLDAFVGYQEHGGVGAAGKQRLLMGPWGHSSVGTRSIGEVNFPPGAERSGWIGEQIRFLNYCLGIDDDGISTEPAVHYYVMGADEDGAPGNEWRTADAWPPPAVEKTLYLRSDGRMTMEAPAADEGTVSFDVDPEFPVPTVCGNNLTLPEGPCDQYDDVDVRWDVVTFTSGRLVADLEVTGRVWLVAHVETDRPDADVAVRLTDLYPDGRSMLILDGIRRLRMRDSDSQELDVTPGVTYLLEIDLWSTSYVFAAKHRIRVSLSGTNSTRFRINPHTGDALLPEDGTPVSATTTLHLAADAPSTLIFPAAGGTSLEIVEDDDADVQPSDDESGCDCRSTRSLALILWLPVVALLSRRRRPG